LFCVYRASSKAQVRQLSWRWQSMPGMLFRAAHVMMAEATLAVTDTSRSQHLCTCTGIDAVHFFKLPDGRGVGVCGQRIHTPANGRFIMPASCSKICQHSLAIVQYAC
jgi:hypothetical protein